MKLLIRLQANQKNLQSNSIQKSYIFKELPSNEVNHEIPKERYISPQETQQIIDELRLI